MLDILDRLKKLEKDILQYYNLMKNLYLNVRRLESLIIECFYLKQLENKEKLNENFSHRSMWIYWISSV